MTKRELATVRRGEARQLATVRRGEARQLATVQRESPRRCDESSRRCGKTARDGATRARDSGCDGGNPILMEQQGGGSGEDAAAAWWRKPFLVLFLCRWMVKRISDFGFWFGSGIKPPPPLFHLQCRVLFPRFLFPLS
ncbi:uncharacterized protein LOC128196307 [Vigna angularis]|uniref:uncharacterized protein LOC128196307 n=1 Tax=Phaseolus angularis TaxID=3914 RepID=UPI0022B5C98A|nr:uncharacterized protein LOC128196307 [Vigna angularis]